MDGIQISLDKDSIQNAVVKAITESAIGAEIEKAINKAITERSGSWHDSKTLVERAVSEVVHNFVRDMATEAIRARTDVIKAKMMEQMSDEVIENMVSTAWSAIRKNMNG